MFIYIKISNNLQFLALATVYGHLATVYYLLQKRAPTVNQIVQNGCLQFISFLGHYFTPVWQGGHSALDGGQFRPIFFGLDLTFSESLSKVRYIYMVFC